MASIKLTGGLIICNGISVITAREQSIRKGNPYKNQGTKVANLHVFLFFHPIFIGIRMFKKVPNFIFGCSVVH